MHVFTRTGRGIVAGVRSRPGVFFAVALAVFLLDVFVPPLVLSLARKPVNYFTFNPWLSRLPEYLTSNPAPLGDKLDKLSGLALFWFSSDNPYGLEWGFAVTVADLGRFFLMSVILGAYFAIWFHRHRSRGAVVHGMSGAQGGVLGMVTSVFGLSTGGCTVMGCGAPVLPVVGLAFAGLSSTTLKWLAGVSSVATWGVLVGMSVGVAYLGWRTGAPTARYQPVVRSARVILAVLGLAGLLAPSSVWAETLVERYYAGRMSDEDARALVAYLRSRPAHRQQGPAGRAAGEPVTVGAPGRSEITMTQHRLDASQVHYEWNNSLPPRLRIEPGDTVVFDTRDAADGFYRPDSTHADVLARGPFRGHPLTGPVEVAGARPGDTLVVEILDMKPRASFGWTAIRPGRGLLPEADFPKPFLQIWDVSDGTHARMGHGIAVPIAAFPGVMGTALPEPGGHSTMPPRKNGGNMDIKQLTAGTVLYLPVWVGGALFSVGDGHAAQGDGEVCVTAVEMQATVTLSFDLQRGRGLPEPRLRTRGPVGAATHRGPHFATTAHGPDLFASAQQAVRYMIEHLVEERGLSREEAYILSSVAVDLKISEIVDAPNWIVSAFLPEMVFGHEAG